MTCAVCPNCGYDLSTLHAFALGDLKVDYNGSIILWKGEHVGLSQAQRCIVVAIARAEGVPVKRIALAEAMGSDERLDPDNLVAVQLNRTIARFREIDPAFDMIENVRGAGLRWKVPVDA
jgi:DNA-binding response OmpR family regulator